MKIGELQNLKTKKAVISFYPEATASEIADKMDLEDIGAVPIVSHEKKIIGIVSERDIVRKLVKNGRDPDLVTANDIMTKDVKKLLLDNTIKEASMLMKTFNFRHLPVVDDNDNVIHFISHKDVISLNKPYEKKVLLFFLIVFLGLSLTILF